MYKRQLLRYADDLLVLCDSRGEAEHYYEMLSKLVTQAGYRLKTNLEQSLFDASEAGDKFEWLGYEVQLKPFKVNLGEQKWFELRRRIEQLKSDHPGNEEEYVDEALFNWAKQALTPMAPSQLDSFQSKVENCWLRLVFLRSTILTHFTSCMMSQSVTGVVRSRSQKGTSRPRLTRTWW